MSSTSQSSPDRKSTSLWKFFILTFSLTWVFWIPNALSGQDFTTTIWLIPMMLGGFGPSLAGIIMTYSDGDKESRRDFWKRVIDIKRISMGWYIFIFLVFPAIFILIFGIRKLTGNPLPTFETLTQIRSNPLMLVGMIVIGIITGPLEEELGWRGFALDHLQKRWSPVVSSLILAPVWWLWHLPLFFIQGTRQSQWDLGSAAFWLFTAGIFPLTVLLTWVYNQNNRSTLAAVLMHFTYNFTMSLVLPLSVVNNLFHVILLSIVAATVVLSTTGQEPKRIEVGPKNNYQVN
jgi:membrane protease YdiL (CAAX protease family)